MEDIVEKIEDKLETAKETVADWADKEKEIYHDKMENGLFSFFEKKFGKKLDKEKFKKVFTEWSQERDPKSYVKNQ
ncbi:TPA: hypothetical protein DIC40_04795 [Patescibacteria group bacterium]|nr:hypothetical protein [Candidatus Gracilibacteria bacterium]